MGRSVASAGPSDTVGTDKQTPLVRLPLSGGVRVKLRVSDHFSVSSGVSLESWQWRNQHTQLRSYVDSTQQPVYGWDPDSVYTVVDTVWSGRNQTETTARVTSNRAAYLGVPIAVTYHRAGPRWGYSCTVGVQLNVLISGQGRGYAVDSLNRTVPSTSDQPTYRKFLPTFTGGIGLSYRISRRIHWLLEQRVAYTAVSAYQRSYPVRQPLWIVDVRTGIRFSF